MLRFLALTGALVLAAAPAMAADGATATAEMKTRDGGSAGTVTLTALQTGTVIHAQLSGLPAGTHAFHIHETGACSGDFSSAGGHFAPDGNAHGFKDADGPHAGDLPNIHAPENGHLSVEYYNDRLPLTDALFDGDGSAVVIHEKADDYATDPAGAAGPRIASGVITQD